MANNNTVKKKKVKMSTGDKVFTVINTIIMILVCIAIVYPLYYVLLASVTDPVVVSSGKILLYPEAWYTNGYETTLKYQPLWTGYANTIKYTVLGTLISLVCTIPAGYALSRYDMVGRKPIMFLFTFTMFFSGGMIPKIDCCVEAVRRGVERAHIIDGRTPHSILVELFTDEGIGTMFTR